MPLTPWQTYISYISLEPHLSISPGKFSGSAHLYLIQIYAKYNKYKKSSDLWWRVWGWWSGSCSRSPPHSVCKGCTAHWTDGEWFLHTLCKQRMTATTVHCFNSIINKTLWIFFSSELAVLTSFSLLLFQNYPPRNKQAGRMWLDILGHMLQQGQRSFSLGRQLGNTRNHQ